MFKLSVFLCFGIISMYLGYFLIKPNNLIIKNNYLERGRVVRTVVTNSDIKCGGE